MSWASVLALVAISVAAAIWSVTPSSSPGIRIAGPRLGWHSVLASPAGFDAVACGGPEACVAVGGGMWTTTSSDGGALWTSPRLVPGPDGTVTAFSCPSATTCLALGGLSTTLITYTTDAGRSWTSQVAPFGVPHVLVEAMSCPNAATCLVSVGIVGRAGSGRLDLLKLSGGSWSLAGSVIPPSSLVTLSCPSVARCVATTPDGAVLVTDNGGGSWANALGVLRKAGLPGPYGVACSSVTTCVVSGGLGGALIVTTDFWRAIGPVAVPLPSFGGSPSPRSTTDVGWLAPAPTCSGGRCWIAGQALVPSYSTPLPFVAVSDDGGISWTSTALPASWPGADVTGEAAGGTGPGTGLWCPSDTRCLIPTLTPAGAPTIATADLAPHQTSLFDQQPAEVVWRAGTDTLAPLPSRNPSLFCPTLRLCFAVRSHELADTSPLAVLRSTDAGRSWTEITMPAGVSQVFGIACALTTPVPGPTAPLRRGPTTDCLAVGASPTGAPVLASSVDAGSSWTPRGLPSGAGDLTSVACTPGAEQPECLVAGMTTLMATTNGGSTWVNLLRSAPAGTPPLWLGALACPSPTRCVASGLDYSSPVASRDRGLVVTLSRVPASTTWTIAPAAGGDTPAGVWLSLLSCPTASYCLLAGNGLRGATPGVTLLESTDGGASWAPGGTPHLRGDVTGLACAGPRLCVAIGRLDAGAARTIGPVLVTDDSGGGFRPQDLPAPAPGVGSGTMPGAARASAACSGPTTCLVTAASVSGTTGLIYRWTGTSGTST